MKLTDKERERIAEAVKRAESETSGEIVPVIVASSDAYPHANLTGGLVGLILFFVFGLMALPWFLPIPVSALITLGFLVGFFVTHFTPGIKRFVIGKKVAETEVYQRALQAFFEHGLTGTRDRTGILILVSMLERRVHVLADEGINAKVEPGTWDEVVQLVLSGIKDGSPAGGLVAGIERCGEILKKDFPIKPDDTNELINDVIVE